MTVGALGFQSIYNTAVETVYGTAVTCDRSYEILASESVKRRNRVIRREGMRGGTVAAYPGTRRIITGHDAAGSLAVEVLPTGMGRLFRQLMGGTPVITQVGATIAYNHSYPLGSLAAKSLTLQKVIRDPDGTVLHTVTQKGAKFTSGEFGITTDQTLRLSLDVDCQSEVKNIAAAAAAYPSATLDPFHFAQATLTVNGAAVANVSAANVKVERPLETERYYLGNAGLKDEPVESDRPKVTGSLTADVINTTLYDLFVADGGGTLVLSFVGGLIVGASNSTITITVPDIHLTDGTPEVSTPGLLSGDLPWESDAGGATITYITTDVAA